MELLELDSGSQPKMASDDSRSLLFTAYISHSPFNVSWIW